MGCVLKQRSANALDSSHCYASVSAPVPPLALRLHRFGFGLGMTRVAKSDQSTGNHHFASYVMQSGGSGVASLPWGACLAA